MPVSVVNTKLRGMNETQAYTTKELIEDNTRYVESFLAQHKDDFDIFYKYNTKDRTHRGFKLPIEQAIVFLDNFRFGNFRDALRKACTIRYLRYLEESEYSHLQYVYFIQMAYAAEIRTRGFDYDRRKIKTNVFAGPSSEGDPVFYPGDRKIFEKDSITIQLHHIRFDHRPLDFPEDAYTLAINYPDELATNYCSNIGENQLNDDDDDDE